MRIFISEYMCSGAWPTPEMPASLAREGRAMWEALVTDFSKLVDRDGKPIQVVSTWDRRLGLVPFTDLPHVHIQQVQTPAQEASLLRQLPRDCTHSLVVAPEFDDILASRCESLGGSNLTSLNAEIAAIRLCSDKLKTDAFCREVGIPSIPTQSADAFLSQPEFGGPFLLKPRNGAGSIGIRSFQIQSELHSIFERDAARDRDQYVVQPIVAGRALSVLAICSHSDPVLLPVAEQHLSDDGQFAYQGGRIPLDNGDRLHCQNLVSAMIGRLPGLRGFIGVDLLIPDDHKQRCLVVEVNPRLTTSYIGYRAALPRNLAGILLTSVVDPGAIDPGAMVARPVEFLADGTVTFPDEEDRA